jgi:hypothetical protein
MPKEYLKKRNWAFVVYPESLPGNWLDILRETGAPIAVSPLHDKDVNADENEKKAHYHVIICYSGPTTLNTVKKLTDKLNAPSPIALEQVRGYYRYLTHKDNPEKFQYDESEIIRLNNFCITDFVELTKSEVAKLKRELLEFIDVNFIYEYSDFIDMLRFDENSEKFDIASNHTFFFNAYLRSKRHKLQGSEPEKK